MTIREAIETILVGYGSAKSQAFAGHALARAARHDFTNGPGRAVILEERYLIERKRESSSVGRSFMDRGF